MLAYETRPGSLTPFPAHGAETPPSRAPELCIEVTSPLNPVNEFDAKVSIYLATGAVEVCIVYSQSRRIAYQDGSGLLPQSGYTIAIDDLFE